MPYVGIGVQIWNTGMVYFVHFSILCDESISIWRSYASQWNKNDGDRGLYVEQFGTAGVFRGFITRRLFIGSWDTMCENLVYNYNCEVSQNNCFQIQAECYCESKCENPLTVNGSLERSTAVKITTPTIFGIECRVDKFLTAYKPQNWLTTR